MKKFLSIILVATMFFGTTVVYGGNNDENVTVNIDGVTLDFDVEPVIENGRVLVPMRTIFENLGCNVSYSVSNGKKFVNAVRGDDYISLEVGTKEMFINGKSYSLDVPSKIIKGRTLVNLRVVSEGLGEKVVWLGNIKTACIYKKHGLHQVANVTSEKLIKSDDDKALVKINYSYPVIENRDGKEKNEYLDYINSEYKTYAEEFVKKAESFEKDARELLVENGESNFLPYEFNLSYKINTDRKGIISITNYMYYNTGGAHPNSERVSRTFDLNNKKELVLSDIVNGDNNQISEMVYDAFVTQMKNNYDGFDDEITESIRKETENVKYYLTDDKLVLYFDVYQVGPYAMGYPSVEFQYSKDLFKIDWSKGSLDTLDINLEGNQTTGYKWMLIDADADKLKVVESYTPKKNSTGLVGVGGTYNFNVKGMEQGNCSISLAYMRDWESSNVAEKVVTYWLYVSKDNKITVLDVDNNTETVIFEAES